MHVWDTWLTEATYLRKSTTLVSGKKCTPVRGSKAPNLFLSSRVPSIGLKCSPSATKHHQRPRVKAKPKPKFRLSAAHRRSLPASTQNQWVFLFGGSRGLLPSWHGQLGWRREVTAGVQSLDRARTIQAVKYSRDKTLWKTDRLVCVTPADLTGRAERQRKDG